MVSQTVQEVIPFPSSVWFEALGRVATDNEDTYRHLGVAEIRLALVIGNRGYAMTFEDYEVSEIGDWNQVDPVDCVVEGSLADWQELIEHIQERGRADSDHTLNSLVLSGARFVLSGDDQLGIDRFYRFNATLQTFLEGAREIATSFSEVGPPG